MERPQLKKMKKRCAIPEKKLKELESIVHQAIEDEEITERRHHGSLLCDEIDQRSFFLNSLLIAEISSCPSPPSEEGHLINIQRCFDALHNACHEWTENSDPTFAQHYLGSHRPQPECTASCFNTDVDEDEDEEDEEEEEEVVTEVECCDGVVAVVPAAEMVSVGVQTDGLLQDDDDEEEEEGEELEKMMRPDWLRKVIERDLFWNENPVSEEEAVEEVVLVGAWAAVAKGVVRMGRGMMMMMVGFMIGRFYYGFSNSNSDYYCYSRVAEGGGRGPLPS